MLNIDSYNTIHSPTWCPGCGDFGIWAAIKNALLIKKISPSKVIFVYDIGCNSNMFMSLKTHGFESLHGRPIPIAEGIRLAASDTLVFVIGGDGGTFGEGTNHLIHAARRNINIKVIIHDNKIYGLTTGQTSPTTFRNIKTKTTPTGNTEDTYNPISLMLTSGASFVAQGFAGDINHLTNILVKAIDHNSFSFVNILQPCVTFNHLNTYPWYRERIYKLEETLYKSNNLLNAIEKSFEFANKNKIPIGIFYQVIKKTYEELLPQLKITPLRDQKNIIPNIDSILQEME